MKEAFRFLCLGIVVAIIERTLSMHESISAYLISNFLDYRAWVSLFLAMVGGGLALFIFYHFFDKNKQTSLQECFIRMTAFYLGLVPTHLLLFLLYAR